MLYTLHGWTNSKILSRAFYPSCSAICILEQSSDITPLHMSAGERAAGRQTLHPAQDTSAVTPFARQHDREPLLVRESIQVGDVCTRWAFCTTQNSLVTPKVAQAVSKSALAEELALLTSSCSTGQDNPTTAPSLLHLGGRETGAFSLRLVMLTQICKSLHVTSPMASLTIIYRAKEEKDSTCLSFVKCNCFVHLGEKWNNTATLTLLTFHRPQSQNCTTPKLEGF